MEEQCLYQNVKCGKLKNQDLSKRDKWIIKQIRNQNSLSKVPKSGDILVYRHKNDWNCKLFLAANNFISEIHFRQPEHTYSAFEPFNKKNQR